MSEAASQTMIEYALADMIYHIENEGPCGGHLKFGPKFILT
jgi:hypothetical protein